MKRIFLVAVLFVLFAAPVLAFEQVSTVVSNNGVTGAVTCSSAATQVLPSQPGRFTMGMVNNDSSKTVYWGYSATVTSSTGIPIYAHSAMVKDRTQRPIYCVTAGSDTVDLRYYWE
jgi:hypothetical protein